MSEQQEASFVLPTSIAVYRYQQMKVESILNTPYQVTDEKTPLEHCLSVSKDPGVTVEALGLNEDQADVAIDLLECALEGGELDEIYGPRGGVLCILLPTTSPDLDTVWRAMEEGSAEALSPEAFVNQPNELFSGLSPAQVWVGAGKHELALADRFLPEVWGRMKKKEFKSPGEANTEWLSQLRLWSYNPASGYRGRVIDIIRQERNENLAKRREMFEALSLETPFLTPPA